VLPRALITTLVLSLVVGYCYCYCCKSTIIPSTHLMMHPIKRSTGTASSINAVSERIMHRRTGRCSRLRCLSSSAVPSRKLFMHALPPPTPRGISRGDYEKAKLGVSPLQQQSGGEKPLPGQFISPVANPEELYIWSVEEEKTLQSTHPSVLAQEIMQFGIPVTSNMSEDDIRETYRAIARLLKVSGASQFDEGESCDPDITSSSSSGIGQSSDSRTTNTANPISESKLPRIGIRVQNPGNLRRRFLNFSEPPTDIGYPSYLEGDWEVQISAAKAEFPFDHKIPAVELQRDLRIPGFSTCSIIHQPDFGEPATYNMRFVYDPNDGKVKEDVEHNLEACINANLDYPAVASVKKAEEQANYYEILMLKSPSVHHAFVSLYALQSEIDDSSEKGGDDDDTNTFWSAQTYRQFWLGPMDEGEAPRKLVSVHQRIMGLRRVGQESYFDRYFDGEKKDKDDYDKLEAAVYTIGYLPSDSPLLQEYDITTRDPVVVYAQKLKFRRSI